MADARDISGPDPRGLGMNVELVYLKGMLVGLHHDASPKQAYQRDVKDSLQGNDSSRLLPITEGPRRISQVTNDRASGGLLTDATGRPELQLTPRQF